MLSKSQLKKVKEQLLTQIGKSEIENKSEVISSIDSMSEAELEQFLSQNKLIRDKDTKCIFCAIIEGEADSIKVGENGESVAILEINPISRGHALVIPRIHSKNTSKKTLELAQEVAEKLKVFEPRKIEVIPKNLFGHEILNILPIYHSESIDSERKPADAKELEKIQETLPNTLPRNTNIAITFKIILTNTFIF